LCATLVSDHQTNSTTNSKKIMATRYFSKEILGSGLSVQGSRVPFEPLAGNQGVIALDNTTDEGNAFIAGLKEVEGRFGIIEITEAEYADLKKKHPYDPSAIQLRRQKDLLQVFRAPGQRPTKQESQNVAAAAAESKPSVSQLAASMPPAPIPLADLLDESFKPATGRSKQAKSKAE
jgi:hypothetical protein